MSAKTLSTQYALLIAAAISLAACSDNPASPAASSAPAAPSSAPAAPAASSASAAAASAAEAASITLDSKDNKVQLVITQNISGAFQDKLADANLLPEGVPAEQVTLLQRNDDADLTLSVVQTGKTDKAADKLFADLKKEIESDQSVKDAQVDAATADSVAYRYTQANDGNATNESCIAHLSADKELAVVCATSGQMSANELKDLLASSVKFN
ncbi:hypothetical protein [Kingella sp. (in: b-proteobacteria)]|uniref:hypothetical protein n=1 Tax=Kingella sp. (in: b-proteobacteria) TaxID=2020713 RepID=UPI0026DAB289|nr:hypothetical protein [Kingella sp. (in: b-proteobacteria)]MDO4657983.1 hypothetical protein [Kingella sp. (in: b-proteobacteria)]